MSKNFSILRFRRDAAIFKTDRTSVGLKRRSQITDHGSQVADNGSQVTDMIIINYNYFNDVKVIEYRVTYFATQQKLVR